MRYVVVKQSNYYLGVGSSYDALAIVDTQRPITGGTEYRVLAITHDAGAAQNIVNALNASVQ